MPAPCFRQTQPTEIDAVRALLLKSFQAADDAPALGRTLLRWKYYGEGPAWAGSRSYVLEQGGQFLAHAAICPLELRLRGSLRKGIGFCDWAASEEHRGIGLLLLKKIMELAPCVLVIGGAEITRQILPRVGFKPWAELPLYARVLRPFRQTMSRPQHNWKEPLRLARNALWSRAALAPMDGWSAQAGLPDAETLGRVHRADGSVQTGGFLEFLLRCPTVRFHSFVLSKAGRPHGYSVVSEVRGQARIADIRIDVEGQADWDAALAAVVCELRRNTAVTEAIGLAPVPHLQRAFAANGFRVRERRPLVIFDRQGEMGNEAVPQIGMLVDDAAFLEFPDAPYVT